MVGIKRDNEPTGPAVKEKTREDQPHVWWHKKMALLALAIFLLMLYLEKG